MSYLYTGITPLTRAIKHALAVQIIQSQMPHYLPDEDRSTIHFKLLDETWMEMTAVQPARPTSAELAPLIGD